MPGVIRGNASQSQSLSAVLVWPYDLLYSESRREARDASVDPFVTDRYAPTACSKPIQPPARHLRARDAWPGRL